ncbi:1589_t:CDS:2, partial [Rhizophagus irregularis]
MSHSGLFEWDDFLNDQIFTGRNGKQQYNSSAAENILNSNYLNTPNIQPLERDMENQEKIQPLEKENFNSLPSFKTYDGSSHIPHYQGEYGPYFPSFTAMALFIWVTKHMISSAAYEGLISILLHKKFRIEDVIKSLRLTPNPLNQLIWDRHISTPQDIFHCFAGKANRLLIATFGLLTHSGEDTFTETWKFFEVPSCWSQWQNPITHLASYFMSDILRLTMIIPFILRRCLTSNLLKCEALTIQFSLTTRMVFSKTLRNEDYETIQKMLELECKMLLEDRGAMINSKVEFYNNISYVVKDDDCFVDVRLHVGDVVDVFEE